MIRTGDKHRASLRDGRQVYLDGGVVADVTRHRAFRNSIDSFCKLYDFQAKPENAELMTYTVAETGERASRVWELPQSYEQLVRRRRALEAATEAFLRLGIRGWGPIVASLSTDQPAAERIDPELASLSQAELRVAEAIAAGLTNREAATRLFLSVKTIDFHLQQMYRKLGVRSRTELAVRIATHNPSGERR